MTSEQLRDTYANKKALQYRLRAAGALLGVSDNTVRSYSDNAGITIKRASELNPGSPAIRVFDLDNLFELTNWRREQGLLKRHPPENGPYVITVDVIKGGTGKSTTTAELALHLQLLGLRVLLIDLDTQANLTQMFGYEADLTLNEAESYGLTPEAIVTDTFATVMLPYIDRNRGGSGALQRIGSTNFIKKPFGQHGPHIIPADTFIVDLDQMISLAKGHRELFFRDMLNDAKDGRVPGLNPSDYDIILFDCPPSVSNSSTNALAAADIVISPIKMDAFSVKGLTKLMSELQGLKKAYKLEPKLIILPTHYLPNLSRISRMQAQLSVYKEFLAPCAISASEDFPRSLDAYLPLTLQKPTCHSANEYRVFADYVHTVLTKISGERK
jgi:cellulose biosynthesis protein BcsQ